MSSRPKIDISPLVKDPDTLEAQIAAILQNALDSAPTTLSSEAIAGDLDKLYPADYQPKEGDGDVVADILWTLWGFLLKVVKKVPADDVRQQLLVDALGRLKGKDRQDAKVWGQDCKMWGDLGLLGPNMREAWDGRPTFNKADAATIQEWTSLNSFAARLHGSSVQTWTNFGIWELRGALEEPPQSDAERDGQLRSSSEWILHAGSALRSKQGQQGELDDMEKRMLKGGSLFKGESGLSDERWGFWRDRFRELGGQVEDEGLKEKINKVVEKMA